MLQPPTKENPICIHGRDTWADDCGMCDASSGPVVAKHQPLSQHTGHKQVIVMRKDLNMRKGKMVAQGAHASLAVVLNEGKRYGTEYGDIYEIRMSSALCEWVVGNFKKICVYVDSEAELLEIHEKAKQAGILTALIRDSGLTEFNGVPTLTCAAIGPDTDEKINAITGHLKLL